MVPTQFNCVLASGDAWEPEFAVRLLRSDHHSVEQDRSSGGYAINGERSRMQERRQCEIKFGGISLVNCSLLFRRSLKSVLGYADCISLRRQVGNSQLAVLIRGLFLELVVQIHLDVVLASHDE